MLEAVKEALGDKVKEVRISKILKTGACCLSADGPVSLEMERYMRKLEGGEHMKLSGCWSSTPTLPPTLP